MIEYENLYKSNLALFGEYSQSFQDFLESGWFILGKQVESFEEEFGENNYDARSIPKFTWKSPLRYIKRKLKKGYNIFRNSDFLGH